MKNITRRHGAAGCADRGRACRLHPHDRAGLHGAGRATPTVWTGSPAPASRRRARPTRRVGDATGPAGRRHPAPVHRRQQDRRGAVQEGRARHPEDRLPVPAGLARGRRPDSGLGVRRDRLRQGEGPERPAVHVCDRLQAHRRRRRRKDPRTGTRATQRTARVQACRRSGRRATSSTASTPSTTSAPTSGTARPARSASRPSSSPARTALFVLQLNGEAPGGSGTGRHRRGHAHPRADQDHPPVLTAQTYRDARRTS